VTKGLFFDIGNTLAADPFPHAVSVLVEAFVDRGLIAPLQTQRSIAELARANETVDGVGFSHFWGEEEIFVEAFRALGLAAGSAFVSESLAIYREAATSAYRTNPELLAMSPSDLRNLLTRAKELGFVIGVVSDERQASIPRYWAILEIGDLVDVVVTSEEIGVGKPHRRIFETALQRAQTPADRSIYVGNDYAKDIVGARTLTMRTVYYTRFNQRRPSEQEVADLVTDQLSDLLDLLRLPELT